MGISALSYFTIPYLVPHEELLRYFLGFIPTMPFLKNPWVFSIKKYKNYYEYELYSYRYLASRTDFHVILDSSVPLLFNDPKYIIASYDLDKDGHIDPSKVDLYYEQINESNYNYHCDTYDYKTQTHSNQYGLDVMILPFEPYHEPFVQKYKTKESIVFIAKKQTKNCYAYYFECIDFQTFLRFLKDFQYEQEFIDFCLKHYNDQYLFCVSYDIDIDTQETVKSTLFSVYNTI